MTLVGVTLLLLVFFFQLIKVHNYYLIYYLYFIPTISIGLYLIIYVDEKK
jgi:hypothetical protein